MIEKGDVPFNEKELQKLREYAQKSVDRLILSALSPETNCDGKEWGLPCNVDKSLKLEVWSSSIPGNSIKMFKAQCIFEETGPKDVFSFLMNDKRLEWDENVCHLAVTVLSEDPVTGDKLVILNCRTNAVGPISGRDFVDICLWKKSANEDGDETYVSAGATYLEEDEIQRKISTLFPTPPGFIRGKNFQGGGWHISASKSDGGEGTVVTYGIHSDLAGWFPAVVINNAIAGSYVSFFKNSKNAINTAKNV